jgi:hypothetical protein
MEDAQYFRARAEFCRQLADQLSDREAATRVRCLAAEYTSKAELMEAAGRSQHARHPERSGRAVCGDGRGGGARRKSSHQS